MSKYETYYDMVLSVLAFIVQVMINVMKRSMERCKEFARPTCIK